MPQPNPEIDALCRELYEQHQLGWRAIRRRLPSERDELHERLGAALCARLSRVNHGVWTHVVRRDAYVRVFRTEWLALGSRQIQPIIGLAAENQQRTYASLHFRVVAEPSDTDAQTRFRYVLRLKGPDPTSTPECAAIADAIRTVNDKVPVDKQYTLALRSNSKHPAIPEDGEVPDDVVDWFFRYMTPYVQAIDRSIKPKTVPD